MKNEYSIVLLDDLASFGSPEDSYVVVGELDDAEPEAIALEAGDCGPFLELDQVALVPIENLLRLRQICQHVVDSKDFDKDWLRGLLQDALDTKRVAEMSAPATPKTQAVEEFAPPRYYGEDWT